MSILKASILSFINSKLERSETDIDEEIITIANDLSNRNMLVGADTSQSLVAGGTTLDYPTRFKEAIAITLNDGSKWLAPLRKLPGGMQRYRELVADNNTGDRDEPEYYAEFNSKLYLWPTADGAYTSNIEFYKYHAQSADTIEFGDEFTNCFNFGATFEVSRNFGLERYMNIWGLAYAEEREMRDLNFEHQPYIVGE